MTSKKSCNSPPCSTLKKVFTCGGKFCKEDTEEGKGKEKEVQEDAKITDQKKDLWQDKKKKLREDFKKKKEDLADAKEKNFEIDPENYKLDIWARWKPDVKENFKGWIEEINPDDTYLVKWSDGLSRKCQIHELDDKRILAGKIEKNDNKEQEKADTGSAYMGNDAKEKQETDNSQSQLDENEKKKDEDAQRWRTKTELEFDKQVNLQIVVKGNKVTGSENKKVPKGWIILKINDWVVEDSQKIPESVAVEKCLKAAELAKDPEGEDKARMSEKIKILFQHEITEPKKRCEAVFLWETEWRNDFLLLGNDEKQNLKNRIKEKWKLEDAVVADYIKTLEVARDEKKRNEDRDKKKEEEEKEEKKNKRLRYIEIERFKARMEQEQAKKLEEKSKITHSLTLSDLNEKLEDLDSPSKRLIKYSHLNMYQTKIKALNEEEEILREEKRQIRFDEWPSGLEIKKNKKNKWDIIKKGTNGKLNDIGKSWIVEELYEMDKFDGDIISKKKIVVLFKMAPEPLRDVLKDLGYSAEEVKKHIDNLKGKGIKDVDGVKKLEDDDEIKKNIDFYKSKQEIWLTLDKWPKRFGVNGTKVFIKDQHESEKKKKKNVNDIEGWTILEKYELKKYSGKWEDLKNKKMVALFKKCPDLDLISVDFSTTVKWLESLSLSHLKKPVEEWLDDGNDENFQPAEIINWTYWNREEWLEENLRNKLHQTTKAEKKRILDSFKKEWETKEVKTETIKFSKRSNIRLKIEKKKTTLRVARWKSKIDKESPPSAEAKYEKWAGWYIWKVDGKVVKSYNVKEELKKAEKKLSNDGTYEITFFTGEKKETAEETGEKKDTAEDTASTTDATAGQNN